MRLTDERMYERVLASDATYNGVFVTGVLTTFTILDAVESGRGAEQDRRHDEAVVHRLRRDAGPRDHVL